MARCPGDAKSRRGELWSKARRWVAERWPPSVSAPRGVYLTAATRAWLEGQRMGLRTGSGQKRWQRHARVGGLMVALCVAVVACGDEEEQSFVPVEFGRTVVRPAGEAAPDELANRYLSPGREFEVIQFEIPDLPCVRSDTTDYLHVPEATTTPGGPAVVYVAPPADASKPVMIAFHGNGLDFIEAEASLLGHTDPELAQALLAADPTLVGYIEIDNRAGALRGLAGEFGNAYVAEALERGWGIVAPGNCWGDGGHGEGEIVDYYIRAPRYGHVMDERVWNWFRERYPHDRDREYSFGCSGGGQRTAQLLLHDPVATAASGIDSPADYLLGFKEDPPALFDLLAGIPEFPAVLDAFYVGHYGSFEGAAEQSLGTQMAARGIQTPIYFTYSVNDTFATSAVTAPLAQALVARLPAERAFVWNTEEAVHCQIQTRERARDALNWLEKWRRPD